MPLNGLVLITGASSGIGAASAERFARDGRPLALWARRLDRLEAVATRCRELGSPQVHIAEIDVRDRGAIDAELTENAKIYVDLDVLLNNAGMAKGMSAFPEAKSEDLKDMVETNLLGFLHVTQAILPIFLQRNSGHLIHLGSVAGRWPYPKGHVYCATKAAVHSLSQSLRMDLNGTAIRVTEISPGMVETEFSSVRFGDVERAKAIYAGMKPLSGDDIAEAVYWTAMRPAHVNIQEIVIYPVAQANPTTVSRRTSG